ncbi:MAG: gliding motility-associated C-terminal domain-containing protein [Bacteroidia bacterium]
MKITFKKRALLLVAVVAFSAAEAQLQCTTYACFLCKWGGDSKMIIPNIFTPNNDNINDYWRPEVINEICLTDYNVVIFSKWGDLVFESSVPSLGWSGNSPDGGIPCSEGAYYYLLTYKNTYTHEVQKFKGFLQLQR